MNVFLKFFLTLVVAVLFNFSNTGVGLAIFQPPVDQSIWWGCTASSTSIRIQKCDHVTDMTKTSSGLIPVFVNLEPSEIIIAGGWNEKGDYKVQDDVFRESTRLDLNENFQTNYYISTMLSGDTNMQHTQACSLVYAAIQDIRDQGAFMKSKKLFSFDYQSLVGNVNCPLPSFEESTILSAGA
jgi:hypothetical protein